MGTASKLALVWSAFGIGIFGLGSPAIGDVIYVDGDLWAGAPAGDGSAESPYTSFATVVDVLEDGDTVYCAGLFTRDNGFDEVIRNTDDYSIVWWTSRAKPVFDGGILIPDAEFSEAVAGERYVAVLPPALTLTTVTEDYREIGGGDPRWKGHLRPVASASAVEATDSSWFYDAITGELHVHPTGGAPPMTSGLPYAYTTPGDGLRTVNCHNFTISDLEFRRICDNTASEGYGINVQTASGARIERVRVIDGGAHALGFTALDGRDNRIVDCEVLGLHGGPHGQNQIVFYSFGPNIEDSVCEGTVFHIYGSLDPHGESLDPSRIIMGGFQHTGGTTTIEPRGLIWRNCTFIGYDGHESRAWSGASINLPAAPPPGDPDLLPIVLEDCTIVNTTGLHTSGDFANVLFDRCAIDLTRRATAPVGLRLGAVHTPMRLGDPGGASAPYFRACTITGDLDPAVSTGAMMALDEATSLTLELTTLHWRSSKSTHPVIRQAGAPAGVLTLRQNVFHRSAAGSLYAGVVPTALDILAPTPNWYSSITTFAPSGEMQSESGWSGGIDPSGVYNVDPQFAAPESFDYTGAAGSAIFDTAWYDGALESLRGVRKRKYDGHFGGVQYGLRICAPDLDDSGGVDGSDLASLLSQWGSAGEGDLNGDGVVDGADLAVMLAGWGGCAETR